MIDLDRCHIGDVRDVLRAWVDIGVEIRSGMNLEVVA